MLAARQIGALRPGLAALGSLKVTAAILVILGLAVVLGYYEHLSMGTALAVPLGLFALNLGAAVLTQPAFRRQTALLVFHLALLALVLLAAFSRLTYLKGGVEVARGAEFDGTLTLVEAGPLHPWHIEALRFRNEGSEVNFAANRRRSNTFNRVSWREEGRERRAVIGDNHPLVLAGYRFYATPNNGFAPVFEWRPAGGGAPVLGSVHLPAYPLLELQQAQTWQLPDGATQAWVMLEFDRPPIPEDRPSILRPSAEHHLILRLGERRERLAPGGSLALPAGSLAYLGLNTWMGYAVYYDPAMPWMLAAGALAVLSLGWHFWRKFAARPWLGAAAD